MSCQHCTIKVKHEVPAGGWRYFQAETKYTVRAASWGELVTAVKNHRIANKIPIGLEIEREIESQLCAILPAGACEMDDKSHAAAAAGLGRLTFAQVLAGTATLIDWALHGKEAVAKDVAEARGTICSRCFYNQNIDGCSTCNMGSIREIANKLTSGEKLSVDAYLDAKACALCGCSSKAHVWVPLDILQRHVDDALNARFPDWCWKKRKESA
jgi:hypothetical protein